MHLSTKLVLASLPLVITLGGWKASLWVNSALGCSAVGKDPLPCMLMGANIQPILFQASWWGMLLWVPGLIVSGLLFGSSVSHKLPKPWGTK